MTRPRTLPWGPHRNAAIMSNPRLLHPLMGVNLRTLLALISQNGTGRYPIHLTVIVATTLLRWPFSTYERWWVERTAQPEKSAQPPVFIVGHWRSGTTFLYNVLSRSPQFAYVAPLSTGLPWDFLTLGKMLGPILEKALPEGRFIDRVPVNPDSPQEDEIALASMQPVSFYHGLYFPRRFVENFNAGIFFDGCSEAEINQWCWSMQHLCKKLQLQTPGRQLLIKNPVYTARIKRLRQLWPEAKFIHIYRNPYVVFHSTMNFYQKLFQELALQPFDHLPVAEVVLNSYPKMIQSLIEDTHDLRPDQFIELPFEGFEKDPQAALEKIYDQLELPHWDTAQPHFQDYLEGQKTYRKNQYTFQSETLKTIESHWSTFIERWSYQPPAAP